MNGAISKAAVKMEEPIGGNRPFVRLCVVRGARVIKRTVPVITSLLLYLLLYKINCPQSVQFVSSNRGQIFFFSMQSIVFILLFNFLPQQLNTFSKYSVSQTTCIQFQLQYNLSIQLILPYPSRLSNWPLALNLARSRLWKIQ